MSFFVTNKKTSKFCNLTSIYRQKQQQKKNYNNKYLESKKHILK